MTRRPATDPTHVWIDRFDDLGVFLTATVTLSWLTIIVLVFVDDAVHGLTNMIIAIAQPAPTLVAVSGLAVVFQVLPRVLAGVTAGRERPAEGSWRIAWSAMVLSALAVLLAVAGFPTLWNLAAAGPWTALGSAVYLWFLSLVSGGLAAVAWSATGHFSVRDWENRQPLDSLGSADDLDPEPPN